MQAQFDAVVVADSIPRMSEVTRAIGPLASLKLVNLDSRSAVSPFASRLGIINIDLGSHRSIERYRAIQSTIDLDRRPRLFAANRSSHRDIVQSYALGATEIVGKPIETRTFVDRIHVLIGQQKALEPAQRDEVAGSIGRGADVLRDMFHATRFEQPIDTATLDPVSETLVETLMEYPIDRWLEIMRTNHHQTFEHCLTVTGTAIGFGLEVGFARPDLVRIASCALVHDIGKSFIPTHILEKPGKLDAEEFRSVRLHPFLGHAALARSKNVHADLLDATLNHHEYIDGSGYPNGIRGPAVSDIARVITIADIFAALIERRAYKRSMPAAEAYAILESMEGKLDMPLVRAFKPVAASMARIVPEE